MFYTRSCKDHSRMDRAHDDEGGSRLQLRLGVAVKIMGRGGMRVADERRGMHTPHLSLSLLMLRDVLLYLASQQVGCYRLPDAVLPVRNMDLARIAQQLAACRALLAEVGGLAQRHAIRLTIHSGMHVVVGSRDAAVAQRGLHEVTALAMLLDALGCGPEGVIVVHVPAAQQALEVCADRILSLPSMVRRRIVSEIGEHGASLAAALRLYQLCGVPVVFDTLHFQHNNPERLPLAVALGLALATWPADIRPKIHFSSQRTEAHLRGAQGDRGNHVIAPRAGQHADYINPFEFLALLDAARGLPPFDIMLEAKAADLALLRLRADLAQHAPVIAEEIR
ncbi:MAG TPA: UV damage endonuclease UvsE [Roseiflexaceae bacterium]|nr:UV damage endonuclease UvsE [Roseiflexaceae bacterium]